LKLLKLYGRTTAEESTDPESIPADLVHHFILGLTTKPGFGICFKDRGWYARQIAGAGHEIEEGGKQNKGRIYNKILSNLLKLLKVNEDPRQNELALRILRACPELVTVYSFLSS
jgi:nucleolar pre-ribosomal-associated protein 1